MLLVGWFSSPGSSGFETNFHDIGKQPHRGSNATGVTLVAFETLRFSYVMGYGRDPTAGVQSALTTSASLVICSYGMSINSSVS